MTMSGHERSSNGEFPPCPACESTSGEEIVLRVAPDEDLYNDPEMEETVRERPFVRCNRCGVLFDAKVRNRHLD